MRRTNATSLLLACSLLMLSLSVAGGAEAPAAPALTCTTNQQCAEGEFCAKLFGSCEESGKCEARPKDCSEHGHSIVKPVCGCDGRSYDNYCLAAAAGTNVKSAGKCASTTPAP